MNPIILLALATFPPLYIMHLLLKADKKDRNNTIVYQMFFIGAALAVPIYYIEVFLQTNILKTNPFTSAFLVASLIEEGIKLFALVVIINKLLSKSSLYVLVTYNYILIATSISLGFATVENILYVLYNGGLSTAIFRVFTAIPLHACCGFLMGYLLSKGKYLELNSKNSRIILAFTVPFFLHGFYDYFILSDKIPWFFALILIIVVTWGIYQLFKVIKVFHYSSKEKIKFSWKKNLIKPGQGEIHTIDSFNEKLNSSIENLFAYCILIVIFFQTSLSENIGNIVKGLFKLLFD